MALCIWVETWHKFGLICMFTLGTYARHTPFLCSGHSQFLPTWDLALFHDFSGRLTLPSAALSLPPVAITCPFQRSGLPLCICDAYRNARHILLAPWLLAEEDRERGEWVCKGQRKIGKKGDSWIAGVINGFKVLAPSVLIWQPCN